MNFHYPFETEVIYNFNFIDVWLEKHGDIDPGYTWDAKTNRLIKFMLPYDNRRMRLDRIMIRENNNLF